MAAASKPSRISEELRGQCNSRAGAKATFFALRSSGRRPQLFCEPLGKKAERCAMNALESRHSFPLYPAVTSRTLQHGGPAAIRILQGGAVVRTSVRSLFIALLL